MKSFTYQAPVSLSEAVALLAGREGKARPLAGGTDLLVQLRLNRFELDLVVDIKKIPELNSLVFDPTRGLTVGAAVSCACLCENRDVLNYYPGLIDAASIIGGTAIQGRATLGGNLCNAAPSGDAIAAMIILGATCTIVGPHGYRNVADASVWPTLSFGSQAARTTPVEAFCVAPGRTILEPGEILVSIHFPLPEANSGARYVRFTPRQEMDIAVAGAGAYIVLNDDQTEIKKARIALSAVAPTPLLAQAAGDSLLGKAPTEEALTEAARLAQEAARPITDVRGTAAQRRHLVGVLVKRALQGAISRAKGETIHV